MEKLPWSASDEASEQDLTSETVIAISSDVVLAPLLSVATAVITWSPTLASCQTKLNGSEEPTRV